jgi:hypothetical protein
MSDFVYPDCMIATGAEGAAFSCRGYGELLAERDRLRGQLAGARELLQNIQDRGYEAHSFRNEIDAFLDPSSEPPQ